jgi:hypothetical protein
MVNAQCKTNCFDNAIGMLYETGKTYNVDEKKPWNWRHFIFPADVDPPAEVLDMLGLSKQDAEAARGQGLPDKATQRKAEAARGQGK